MSNFTPGPWGRNKYGSLVNSKGDSVVLRSVAISLSGPGVDEAEANTDLVAAAPDLLAALQSSRAILLQLKEQGYLVHVELAEADFAIAKAMGENT